MGRLRVFAATALAVCVSLLAAPFPVMAPANGADTSLPIPRFGDILVDQAHGRVFITGGTGSNSIVVTDLDGKLLAPIPNAHGAQQLLLSHDGTKVYVGLSQADAVGVINTTTLAMTTINTGTSSCPYDVAETAGRIWYSHGCGQWDGAIGFIDLADGNAVHASIRTGFYSAPQLESSPALPGQVAFANRGTSPGGLYFGQVTVGGSVTLPTRLTIDADVRDMAITPNGSRVITTSMAPYIHPVYLISNGSADGSYDTNTYPNAVAVRPDGMVAAGTFSWYDPDIHVYGAGSRTLFRSYDFGATEPTLAQGGLAFGATRLYAILQTGHPSDATYKLRVITPRRRSSVSISSSTGTYRYGAVARLTVHLRASGANKQVSVYAKPIGGRETLLKSGTVDATGRVTAAMIVKRRTTFRVAYAGDATYDPSGDTVGVAVRAKVTPAVRGWFARNGRYHLYRPAAGAIVLGTVAPNHAGDCLYFRGQYYAGRWRGFGVSRCVRLTSASKGGVRLSSRNLVGLRLRVRAEWRGDAENAAQKSAWRYVKFVR